MYLIQFLNVFFFLPKKKKEKIKVEQESSVKQPEKKNNLKNPICSLN